MLGFEEAARLRRAEHFLLLRRKLRTWLRDNSKWVITAVLFSFCIGPIFISYTVYLFEWDDADYLTTAIEVGRTFWSGDVHGLRLAMVGIKPPAMTLLGLPWGPLVSWNAAGKCFITLAAAISLLAASSLYLLLRIGVKPLFVIIASVCVGASLGPYPRASEMHFVATGFMADSLLAWTTLAGMLLISYEARTPSPLTRHAILRGIVWGSLFSAGIMTKFSFLYFIVCTVPVLLIINLVQNGFRRTLVAFIAFMCCSAPAVFYFLRWGRPIVHNAKAASFGVDAETAYIPLLQFFKDTLRDSPGVTLSLGVVAVTLVYFLVKRRLMYSWPDFLAFLIVSGFAVIALSSANRQIRYAFPAIVALPFLAGILMSGDAKSAPSSSAALAAGIVFCGLLAASVPTGHRANWESLTRSDSILAQVVRCNSKRVLLATDSPTLNINLMDLALKFSTARAVGETLVYNAFYNVPIEEDFRAISESDLIVFQDEGALSPPYTNQRVSEYKKYIQQRGYVPTRIAEDVSVYSIRCGA